MTEECLTSPEGDACGRGRENNAQQEKPRDGIL
jgi:hypothetical protein